MLVICCCLTRVINGEIIEDEVGCVADVLNLLYRLSVCELVHNIVLEHRVQRRCVCSLEHQNPSKTSEIMGYFDRVDDRVTVLLHILYTANQETEGSQDRLTV